VGTGGHLSLDPKEGEPEGLRGDQQLTDISYPGSGDIIRKGKIGGRKGRNERSGEKGEKIGSFFWGSS